MKMGWKKKTTTITTKKHWGWESFVRLKKASESFRSLLKCGVRFLVEEGRRGAVALPLTQQVCPLGPERPGVHRRGCRTGCQGRSCWGVGGRRGMPQRHCQDTKGPSSRLNVLISKSRPGPKEGSSFFERYAQKCKRERPRMAMFKVKEDPVQGTRTGDQPCARGYRSHVEESNRPHLQGLSYPLVGRIQHFQDSSKVRTRKIESQGGIKNSGAWKHKEITLRWKGKKLIIIEDHSEAGSMLDIFT